MDFRHCWRYGSLCILVLGVLIAGCAGSTPGTSTNEPLPENAREVNVAAKLQQRSIAFVEELLLGEPSVRVTGRQVRIRGSKSAPLWVIDGVYTDSPAGLNPHDVDRMWINASGRGYGRRGANGVIILTTKVG